MPLWISLPMAAGLLAFLPALFPDLEHEANLFRGDRPAVLAAARTGVAKEHDLYVPPDPRMECEQSPHSMPEGLNGYHEASSAFQVLQADALFRSKS